MNRRNDYRILNQREVRLIKAIGDTMFPEGGVIPYSARDVDILGFIDDYLNDLPRRYRFMVRILFLIVDYGTLFTFFSLRRMSSLEPERRERYLTGWEDSGIYFRRIAFTSLRTIFCMAYIYDEGVLRHIGYFNPEGCE